MGIHKCDICDREYSTAALMKHHYKKSHNIDRRVEQIRRFKCSFPKCSFSCERKGSLKEHLASNHSINTKRYPCSLCPYVAKSKGNINLHLTNRHKLKYRFVNVGKNKKVKVIEHEELRLDDNFPLSEIILPEEDFFIKQFFQKLKTDVEEEIPDLGIESQSFAFPF